MKERRLEKKKNSWIAEHLEEWYFFSILLVGDRNHANKLVEKTVHTIKNKFIFFPSNKNAIKPLIKEFRKYDQNDKVTYQIHEKTPLLNNLTKVKEEDRMVLLLKYVYKHSYNEVGSLTRMSDRKIKEKIYRSISVWTDNGKMAKLQDIERVLANEISVIPLSNDSNPYMNKVVNKANQEIKVSKKRRLIFSGIVLCLLFIGGTLNENTIQATRLSLGPDIYKLYKDGGAYQLESELYKNGYKNVYVNTDFNGNYIELYSYSQEEKEHKEEIIAFAQNYLEDRNLDYTIGFELFTEEYEDSSEEEMEVELTEGEKQMEKEIEMDDEIYHFLQENTTFYGASWDENNDVEYTIVDNVSDEDEQKLVQGLKEIMQKYDIERNFSFLKIPTKKVEIEENFWQLSSSIREAFYQNEKFGFQDVSAYFEEERLEIIVYTTLSPFSTDENNTENQIVAKEIKRSLDYFLSHKEIKELIQNAPYEITVIDQTGSEIIKEQ